MESHNPVMFQTTNQKKSSPKYSSSFAQTIAEVGALGKPTAPARRPPVSQPLFARPIMAMCWGGVLGASRGAMSWSTKSRVFLEFTTGISGIPLIIEIVIG